MMKDSQNPASGLYRNLRILRYILPIAAFLLVVAHQTLAYTTSQPGPRLGHFAWNLLIYGTVGPVVVWFALTWFARWVRERDRAEAHLRCLDRVSRQAATATDMETLVDIALRMPEEILDSVATSLILREHPDGPWTLAGTRHLQMDAHQALTAQLVTAGSELRCGGCPSFDATLRDNCPLRSQLPEGDLPPDATAVICLTLSTGRPPFALLNVYLSKQETLPPDTRRVLESMAAVLAMAMDHARLRAREFQMLHRMEQAVHRQQGMTSDLEQILADIAFAHRAEMGEVFLTSDEAAKNGLIPIASWPEKDSQPRLAQLARQVLHTGDSVVEKEAGNKKYLLAVPLMAEGSTLGTLALAGKHPFTPSQAAFLRVAGGMLALIIRNSQLYAELERQAVLEERNRLAREVHDGLAQSLGFLNFKMQQVDRLLSREKWDTAQQALREMRQSVQDLYAELRLTIQDLRWLPEDEEDLVEWLDEYVSAFADRSGLDVSLSVKGVPTLMPQDEIHLLRIVQEALSNVHKHARARRAWVRLQAEPEQIILEIEDDGVGLPEEYSEKIVSAGLPEHFGLRIMQERAEAMGGCLSVDSTPGEGTRLQMTVALSPSRLLKAEGRRVVSDAALQALAPGNQDL